MNPVSRGIKNALRSPLRSGAIILIFSVSVALILSMLLAAVGVTLFVAIVGSALPAWLTARVRPAEVLRSE